MLTGRSVDSTPNGLWSAYLLVGDDYDVKRTLRRELNVGVASSSMRLVRIK